MSSLAELASQLEAKRRERDELLRQLTYHRTPRFLASKEARENAAAKVERQLISVNHGIKHLEKRIRVKQLEAAGYVSSFSVARTDIGKHCIQLILNLNCQTYMGVLLELSELRGQQHASNYVHGYRCKFQKPDGSIYSVDYSMYDDILLKFSDMRPVLDLPCAGENLSMRAPYAMPAPSAPPATPAVPPVNWRSLIDPARPYNLPRRMMNARKTKSRRQRKQRKFTRKM